MNWGTVLCRSPAGDIPEVIRGKELYWEITEEK